MMRIDFGRTRYSVCIAQERETGDVQFARIADCEPDDAEEGDELIPAYSSDITDSYEQRCANPPYIYCRQAFHNYGDRTSDVYAFEWKVNALDQKKQDAREWRNSDGRPVADDVREVVTIAGVQSREDLVEALRQGYPFDGLTTRQFYLVYERPTDYMRYAIKCKRDDFVAKDRTIRLLDSVANVRQSILSAPIVVLAEHKIISADIAGGPLREIYSCLRELDEEEGNLPLRPFEYYAADYVGYYLRHCQASVKLTDKERRYAVAQAIDEALARPDEITAYLDGAECPRGEIEKLKNAIAMQLTDKDDGTLSLVRNALMENEAIRERCVSLAELRGSEKLNAAHKELERLEKRADEVSRTKKELEVSISGLEEKKSSLIHEIEMAEADLSKLRDAESKLTRQFEENVALKLGLGAVCHSMMAVSSPVNAAPSAMVSGGAPVACDDGDGNLAIILAENFKRLGAYANPPFLANLKEIAVGTAACVSLKMPLAVPEPAANVLATALAAALYSSEPTRMVVPTDFRDIASLKNSLEKPGVYLIEGVVDSVNEGILFPLLHRWENAVAIFTFRSHASAMLLAKETWDCLFVPRSRAITWSQYTVSSKQLLTINGHQKVKPPKKKAIVERADDLAQCLHSLGLPISSFVLPAAVSLIAEDEYETSNYEAVISQHLAFACGGGQAAVDALIDWIGEPDDALDLKELLLRIGGHVG